ncbi:MAG: diguanylate cyclase [Acidobacteriaceae bacterium]
MSGSRPPAVQTKALEFEDLLRDLFKRRVISSRECDALLEAHRVQVANTVESALEKSQLEVTRLERRCAELSSIAENGFSDLRKKYDTKTGLLDGDYFEQLLPQFVDIFCSDRRNFDRRSECPCLVIGDVRKLKVYNDTLGHDVGDAVLKAVGATILENIRAGDFLNPGDFAARSNDHGDEIIILIHNTQAPNEAFHAASRLKDPFGLETGNWGKYHPAFKEPMLRPNVDFGAAALRARSLRGVLKGLSAQERQKRIADLIVKWKKKADGLMYLAKGNNEASVRFAWFDYRDGDLVDITDQIFGQKFLRGVRTVKAPDLV